jgi:lysozyme family protein
MSNFDFAFTYLMGNEVANYGGPRQNPHYEDPRTGEISAWGISLAWLRSVQPDATAEKVRGLDEAQAKNLYLQYWWKPGQFDLISDACVAAKTFDACVNMGMMTGIKILQCAIGNLGDPIVADGRLGQMTADAIQYSIAQHGVRELLSGISGRMRLRYQVIAAKNPALARDLAGWTSRANKLPEPANA